MDEKFIPEILCVKKLNEYASLPIRHHEGDAGYDLSSCENVLIQPKEWKLVSTGIALTVLKNTYGRIAPRSGFSYKKGTMIGAGVIDRGYTGEVKVLVFNLSNETIEIKIGDRIAQLILEVIKTPDILEVTKLNNFDRGDGGFGSTDKK